MSLKTQLLIYLLVLALFDTLIPVPITAMLAIYILLQRPVWFKSWVDEIFQNHGGNDSGT